ncbi:uncharacterized protein HKW66_Vig0071870 [Vigna angularis]|uniref:Uncharacterized protein n=1 Tax=Phaseolus angularis TaxID=3914 RepID=A0A8T0K6Q5_PHAAN|nr:uncharacterized protein LOC128197416 [Vigna angularis]XP_052735245.1 uncharacterized protein LOC128197416 [Vigna angularis]KAG2395437.1 uncharacterized protein HKW66_Vig0071870 [Vigna angularis]
MAQHTPQVGYEDDLFTELRMQVEKMAKEVGRTDVPNLQQPETDIYHPGFDKKILELERGRGVGKERKRLRATILDEGKDKDGVARLSTEFREGAFDISELEGPLIRMHKGVSIELGGHERKVINDSDPEILFRGLLEFQTRALVLSRRVVHMARKELKGESKMKLARDLIVERNVREEEHRFWAHEKKKLENEKKLLEKEVQRMKSWKAGCLEAEKKVRKLNAFLKEYVEEVTKDDLQHLYNFVSNAHRKGFQKGIRQANFLYKEVSTTDFRFDVNKDIFDGRMLDDIEIFTLAGQEAERVVVEEDKEDEENVEDNLVEM